MCPGRGQACANPAHVLLSPILARVTHRRIVSSGPTGLRGPGWRLGPRPSPGYPQTAPAVPTGLSRPGLVGLSQDAPNVPTPHRATETGTLDMCVGVCARMHERACGFADFCTSAHLYVHVPVQPRVSTCFSTGCEHRQDQAEQRRRRHTSNCFRGASRAPCCHCEC